MAECHLRADISWQRWSVFLPAEQAAQQRANGGGKTSR
jgi:hypothetical protein